MPDARVVKYSALAADARDEADTLVVADDELEDPEEQDAVFGAIRRDARSLVAPQTRAARYRRAAGMGAALFGVALLGAVLYRPGAGSTAGPGPGGAVVGLYSGAGCCEAGAENPPACCSQAGGCCPAADGELLSCCSAGSDAETESEQEEEEHEKLLGIKDLAKGGRCGDIECAANSECCGMLCCEEFSVCCGKKTGREVCCDPHAHCCGEHLCCSHDSICCGGKICCAGGSHCGGSPRAPICLAGPGPRNLTASAAS